jgi:GTP-binding protein HflX
MVTEPVLGEAGAAMPDEMPHEMHGRYEADESAAAPGDMDLEDRQALRRVAGLSTELQDVTEVEYRSLRLEQVVLIGVWAEGSLASAENSLRELSLLAETAGSHVLEGLMQRRSRPDSATYVGAGKAAELADIVASAGADTVICDGELSPSQLRRLESIVKVKVIDRTALILDIFAQHARSREGKAQVELAQLAYMLPRLRGWGESMSRQAGGRVAGGGGIGTRGPGETKIETDRRRIRTRMARLRREISGMATGREVQRGQRRRREVPSVVIAGYTNAGKSSLLNRLTGAGVLVEDALFATLDPAVRRAKTPSGRALTLTDTVGFVRHLPHQLVDAFRSTLEETADADLILHVVDGSDPEPEAQIAAVRAVLAEIGARHVPELVVINKCDAADPIVAPWWSPRGPEPGCRRCGMRWKWRCPGGTARSRPWCPTAGVTWWRGPTRKARCCTSGTAPTERNYRPGCRPRSRPSSSGSRSPLARSPASVRSRDRARTRCQFAGPDCS